MAFSRLKKERISTSLTTGRLSLIFPWCKREGGSTVLQSSQEHSLRFFGWTAGIFTLKNKIRKYSKNVQNFSFMLLTVLVTGMGKIN